MEILIKEKLRAVRDSKGWSREYLARLADVTTQTIFRAETSGRINLQNYFKIYNALHDLPAPDPSFFTYVY